MSSDTDHIFAISDYGPSCPYETIPWYLKILNNRLTKRIFWNLYDIYRDKRARHIIWEIVKADDRGNAILNHNQDSLDFCMSGALTGRNAGFYVMAGGFDYYSWEDGERLAKTISEVCQCSVIHSFEDRGNDEANINVWYKGLGRLSLSSKVQHIGRELDLRCTEGSMGLCALCDSECDKRLCGSPMPLSEAIKQAKERRIRSRRLKIYRIPHFSTLVRPSFNNYLEKIKFCFPDLPDDTEIILDYESIGPYQEFLCASENFPQIPSETADIDIWSKERGRWRK